MWVFFYKWSTRTAPVCIPGHQHSTSMHTGTARRQKNGGRCAERRHGWGFPNPVFEATNANWDPESVHVKWRRGYLPCEMREVIFNVGLNLISHELLWGACAAVILSDRIAVVHHHPNLTSRYFSCCPRCWGRIWLPVLLRASCFSHGIAVLLYYSFWLCQLSPFVFLFLLWTFSFVFAIHIFIFIYMCVCSAILSVQIFIAHMCCQVILTFKVFVNTEQITKNIFCRVSMLFFCVDKYCVRYNRNTILFSLFSSVCSLSNREHK